MPCFPAGLQAPAKGFFRPGVWMPGAREFHTHTESWRVDGDPSHCVEETLVAVEHLNEAEHPTEFYVNKVRYEDNWVQVFCYTPAGWLDILEVKYISFEENHSLAKVTSFSTGLLPAWVPLGFLCDMALCWLPFGDHGSNAMRCQSLREALPFNVDILEGKEGERLIPKSYSGNCSAPKYQAETDKEK